MGYALFLYVVFTLPPSRIPKAITLANDKVLHFFDFLLLALLAFRAFSSSSSSLLKIRAGQNSLLFSLFYAAVLEWVQEGIPGRDTSLGDFLADGLGTLVASGIFAISRLTPSK